MGLSRGKILEENLFQSAVHQTLGDEFTFQQDNNLKHKAKSTLELIMVVLYCSQQSQLTVMYSFIWYK